MVRLTQVVANLLNNAAKYTEPGGRHRDERAAAGRPGRLTVADNGIGMPHRAAEHDLRPLHADARGARAVARRPRHRAHAREAARRAARRHRRGAQRRSRARNRGRRALPAAGDERRTPPRVPTPAPVRSAASLRILAVDDNRRSRKQPGQRARPVGPHGAHGATTARPRSRWRASFRAGGRAARSRASRARRSSRSRGRSSAAAVCRRDAHLDVGVRPGADPAPSDEAGFHHHLVKPVDLDRLRGLLEDWARASDRVASGSAALVPSS